MAMRNTIIIQDVSFDIYNFNGTGKNYMVNAYAQDSSENDMYTVNIAEKETGKEVANLYSDSYGGTTEEYADNELINYVVGILFCKEQYGIIRSFISWQI